MLTREQAELYVVAEGRFRPTDEETDDFIEKKGIPQLGIARALCMFLEVKAY